MSRKSVAELEDELARIQAELDEARENETKAYDITFTFTLSLTAELADPNTYMGGTNSEYRSDFVRASLLKANFSGYDNDVIDLVFDDDWNNDSLKVKFVDISVSAQEVVESTAK